MIRRSTIVTVSECPIEPGISLENCKKCPYYITLDLTDVLCDNLTKSEIKMIPEPAKDKEYIVKW